MAGTSAVFLREDHDNPAPVERDGRTWTADELHLESLPCEHQKKPAMSNVIALEGLEEYDAPCNGDVRKVDSIGSNFIYFNLIRGWVQIK